MTILYEIIYANVGEAPTIVSDTVNLTFNSNIAAWTHSLFNLATITPNLRPGGQFDIFIRRVRDANNTYADPVHLKSIGVHALVDSSGSNDVDAK
jgi:hypothetical protein